MRIVSDHQRHVALEVKRGPKWVDYISLAATGPKLHHERCAYFDGVFNHNLSLTVEVAAARMLKGSTCNADLRAVNILKEIIMSNTKVTEMKLAEIVAEYNLLAESLGKPAVKRFSTRVAGEERLTSLRKEVAKAAKASGAAPAKGKGKAKAEKGEGRKPGSGARIRELLKEGLDADAILAVIHKEFPQSKAGKSDVSWNRSQMAKGRFA